MPQSQHLPPASGPPRPFPPATAHPQPPPPPSREGDGRPHRWLRLASPQMPSAAALRRRLHLTPARPRGSAAGAADTANMSASPRCARRDPPAPGPAGGIVAALSPLPARCLPAPRPRASPFSRVALTHRQNWDDAGRRGGTLLSTAAPRPLAFRPGSWPQFPKVLILKACRANTAGYPPLI